MNNNVLEKSKKIKEVNLPYMISIDPGPYDSGVVAFYTDCMPVMKDDGHPLAVSVKLGETFNGKERRLHAGSRNRIHHMKNRKNAIRKPLYSAVKAEDETFFKRLKKSGYKIEDKDPSYKNVLYADKDYTDKDFYREFPTLYHLRKSILDGKTIPTAKMIEMIFAHATQHRGHFLYNINNDDIDKCLSFDTTFIPLAEYVYDCYGVNLFEYNNSEVSSILSNSFLSVAVKYKEIVKKYPEIKADKFMSAIFSLICGKKAKANDVFSSEDYEDINIIFNNSYEDIKDEYIACFDDKFMLIDLCHSVYNWGQLISIMKEERYISSAIVRIHDEHHDDLKSLKGFVIENIPSEYKIIFDEQSAFKDKGQKKNRYLNNYASYINGKCSQNEFCSFVLSKLPEDIKKDKENHIVKKLSEGRICPKIVDKKNTSIPIQVNTYELKKILEIAKPHLPVLNELTENGMSVADFLLYAFSFKIPYYAGPLGENNKYSNIVRKNGYKGPITIENFYDVVDLPATYKKNIDTKIGRCTYLPDEPVMPANSLVYSSYKVLQEIANISINGAHPDADLMHDIYNQLFLTKEQVTKKDLINLLKAKGFDEITISGMKNAFVNNLKPYLLFKEFELTDSEKEKAIELINYYNTERVLLKKALMQEFAGKLSTNEIEKIAKFKLHGWGSLSKKLLTGLYFAISEDGEALNLLEAIWTTGKNMQVLMGKGYLLSDAIVANNCVNEFKLGEAIKNSYLPFKAHRSVRVIINIVKDFVKYMGYPPVAIYIENTRFDGDKVESVKNKDKIIKYLQNTNNTTLEEIAKELSESDFNINVINFFMQEGICCYTGKPIRFEDVLHRRTTIVNKEHIYPRSKIADDSKENLVLAYSDVNNDKGAVFPISKDIQTKMKPTWDRWLKNGGISKEKYARLTRTTPLDENDIIAFCGGDLTATGAVANFLKTSFLKMYKNINVEFVRPACAQILRKQIPNYTKNRAVNDMHHAYDALIAGIAGYVLSKWTKQHNFYTKWNTEKISMERMFEYSIENVWDAKNSLEQLSAVIQKNNIECTKYSSIENGTLYKATILKAKQGSIPLKENGALIDTDKYGGRTEHKNSCCVAFTGTKKNGKTVGAIRAITRYEHEKYGTDFSELIKQKTSLENLNITRNVIKLGSLIEIDGFPYTLEGGSGNNLCLHNALQLRLEPEYVKYLKAAGVVSEEYVNLTRRKISVMPPLPQKCPITKEKNLEVYEKFIYKLKCTKYKIAFKNEGDALERNKEIFINLNLHEQCNVLVEILKIFSCNGSYANLSLLGMGKSVGRIHMTGNFEKGAHSVFVIDRNLSGTHKKRVDAFLFTA